MPSRIPFDRAKIEAFCQKWRVREFALFGSVLREDFRDDSDVDVLVEVRAGQPGQLLGLAGHARQAQGDFRA
jgi:predicted nucleotidyltransferase